MCEHSEVYALAIS